MIPILYARNDTNFNKNGLGLLSDAISCIVTEERNGAFELELKYPITGLHYESLDEDAVIKAKPNDSADNQLFRVYKSSKPINGIVTYYAEHISYGLNGNPIPGIQITNSLAAEAILKGLQAAVFTHSFTAWSDVGTTRSFENTSPLSVRAFLGGSDNSVLEQYGGEFEFDNFTIKLHAARGSDTGVVIEYGKNLTDIKQERNIEEVYTALYPYAIKKESTEIETTETLVTLSEKILPTDSYGAYGHDRAMIKDFSGDFEQDEEITESALREKAQAYLEENTIDTPSVNITVSFLHLWQTADYAAVAPLEKVKLCDTVTVRFAKLGVEAKAKVIKTVFNTLTEKYDSIELGDAKSSFADTVLSQEAAISSTNTALSDQTAYVVQAYKAAIKTATDLITGQSGGYVVLNPAHNPQEILVMDTADIETATKVWRWNSAGLGYSSNGYNGPYSTAITMNGAIVADFITTGTLTAIAIEGGTINAAAITGGTIEGAAITGGTLNINDKFKVDASGNVAMTGAISWSVDSSPIKIKYSVDKLTWYDVFQSSWTGSTTTQVWAKYSYDGGSTWTEPLLVQGKSGVDGSDGSDATVNFTNVNNILKNYFGIDGGTTQVNSSSIYSPTIYAAKVYAGEGQGYSEMLSTGLNVYTPSGLKKIGIGWNSSDYEYPYIILGVGSDEAQTTAGMIKKFSNGIWIGNAASKSATSPSGTGIFIDFNAGAIYQYIDGTASSIGGGNVTAVWG